MINPNMNFFFKFALQSKSINKQKKDITYIQKTIKEVKKKHLNKWKDIPCSWVGGQWFLDNNTFKMTYIWSECNPCQTPIWLLYKKLTSYPKIHMEIEVTQNSQNNLEKEQHNRRIHTSQFQNLL